MDKDLYARLKAPVRNYEPAEVKRLFALADKERVQSLASRLKEDIEVNLPKIYNRRKHLSDYRANPYVLLATANIMGLGDADSFASFLFNSKLSMGLETSFGKIIERQFLSSYPCEGEAKWRDPPEKLAEFELLREIKGRPEKARFRNASVWREIDKEVYRDNRRYLVTIKSGPNTINDTQVQGMVDAIYSKHEAWLAQSRELHPKLEGIDVVLGLTYGTEKTTNNKDNQILAKLHDYGFAEHDMKGSPGILVNKDHSVRVYRQIGQPFWSFVGNPVNPDQFPQVFLEILLGLAIAMSDILEDGTTIEEGINARLSALASALMKMQLSKDALPDWLEREISEDELFWFMTALSSFFDRGV